MNAIRSMRRAVSARPSWASQSSACPPRASRSSAVPMLAAVLTACILATGVLASPAPHGGNHHLTPTAPPPMPAPPAFSGPANKATTKQAPPSKVNTRRASSGPTGTLAVDARGSRRGGRGGATTGLGFAPDLDGPWELWWEANRDGLLQRTTLRGRAPVVSADLLPLSGRGRHAAGYDDASARGSALIPVIQELLRTEDDANLCDSGVLSLARIADDTTARFVLADIQAMLEHPALSVRTAATLSLGLLPGRQARRTLVGLMADTSVGRAAMGGGRVPWQVRSHAALALGLSGDPLAAPSLVDLARRAPESERDLRVCAVTALGLIDPGDDGTLAASTVEALVELLGDERTDRIVRAQAPIALARLDARGTRDLLVELLEDERTEREVRQSCAIALGRLADLTDKPVVRLLEKLATDASDAGLRHFALIALARAGARTAADEDRRHDDLRRFLVGELRRPSRKIDLGWTALAAGVYGLDHPDARDDLAAALAKQYGRQGNPSTKAALALGRGLLGDASAAAPLLRDFVGLDDEELRGHLALALGMLGHEPAVEPCHALLARSSTGYGLRLQIARALAVMGAPGTAEVLLRLLEESDSAAVSWSVSRALGELRDPDSVGPLVAIAEDTARTELPRAFAVLALGLIGERGEVRWNVPLNEDGNTLASVETLASLLTL